LSGIKVKSSQVNLLNIDFGAISCGIQRGI
jgi:hypothetical protein